jgi:hypothetical protein
MKGSQELHKNTLWREVATATNQRRKENKMAKTIRLIERNVFASAIVMTMFFLINASFANARDIVGIATQGAINLPANSSVSVYNGGPDSKAVVRTNSTAQGDVSLGYGTTINGDVVVGPGGNPSAVINNRGATITGDVYAADEPMFFVPVMVPDYLAYMPSGGIINNSTALSASGKFSGIDLGNADILTINGDVKLFVTGSVLLGNSSQIIINQDSSLILYLVGNLGGINSAGFTNWTQDASNLLIYATDNVTDFRFKNSSNWYGMIYAPNADVAVNNSGDLYGTVIANSFLMKNPGTFYSGVSIPEPATLLLIGLGMAIATRKQKK